MPDMLLYRDSQLIETENIVIEKTKEILPYI